MKVILSFIAAILLALIYLTYNQDNTLVEEDTLSYIESFQDNLKKAHKSNILRLMSLELELDSEDSPFLASTRTGKKTQTKSKTIILEKKIKELERAIKTLESGLKEYKVIKVKVFPVEKIKSIDSIHTVKSKEEMKYASIENINPLVVKEVDWTTNRVIKNYGEFKKIDIHFEEPTNLLSSKNKLILTKDSFSSLGKEELTLGKLKSSSTSIVITPLNTSRQNSIPYGSNRDEYFKSGFSKLSWGQNKNYFYRGGFEITYSHRYLSGSPRIWTVINLVDIYDYMHSVASQELRQAKGSLEAKKAQTVATRTYAVLKASQARTKKYNPRTWDLLPTTAHQIYLGATAEIIIFEKAIHDTKNKILVVDTRHGSRPAFAEYFGCTNQRTLDDHDPPRMDLLIEQEARNVPSVIDCGYAKRQIRTKRDVSGKILAYGHGRGMCQKCAIHLAKNGWGDTKKEPTKDAALPVDINLPWRSEQILMYFYNRTKIKDIDDVMLGQKSNPVL